MTDLRHFDTDLAIAARLARMERGEAALPAALRALLGEHPREGWRAGAVAGGHALFWLDRHLAFRRLLALMRSEAAAAADGRAADGRAADGAFAPRLAGLGNRFLHELHGHHGIEDHYFFPRLAARAPALEAGFAMLEADHAALDPLLAGFAKRAGAAIRAAGGDEGGGGGGDDSGEAARLVEALDGLGAFLDRHLLDEEDLVVPVFLRHGEAFLEG